MERTKIILFLIIFFGFIVRLQNFSLPPIDAHAFRQTDTECVAYNFVHRDSNILHPQACLIRPQTNDKGYFFLEFPAYQYGLSVLYRIFGNTIYIARIYNLFLYIVASLSLYYFVSAFYSKKIALWSLLFFVYAPGSIFFIGHAIHPDVFAITMLSASLAMLIYFLNSKRNSIFFLSVLLLSFAIATRPFALLILPSYLYVLYLYKKELWRYVCAIIGSIFMYGAWRHYISSYPPEWNTWEHWVILEKKQLFQINTLVKRLILKNIVGEVMGKITSLFALFGLIFSVTSKQKKLFFPLIWLMGVPFYWYFAPLGNITHQYYANIYLIPIVILAGVGASFLMDFLKNKKMLLYLLIFVIPLITIYNGYRTSSYFFNDIEPESYIEIAKDINAVIPKNSKLVYLATLNNIPMSLAHRQGWVLSAAPVDVGMSAEEVMAMKENGVEYIVEGIGNTDLNKLELEKLRKNTKIIFSSKWTIISTFK